MTNKVLTDLSISELQYYIKNKEVSPVEVVQEAIFLIQEKGNDINAFITSLHQEAIKEAQKAEKNILSGNYKGPLHGIPIGIKDIIHLKGSRTTSGSELFLTNFSEYDAEVVQRLKNNGAILIGKENMHSLAYGSSGSISHFGPVKNPLDLTKITGGSSSGSSAAVAAGFSYGSIGSDTGGSIRIPAACCGVVGMKPTFGLISRHGTSSLAPTLDTLGPITRTVKDNAIMLDALSGYDSKDSFSINYNQSDSYASFTTKSLSGATVGIPSNFYFDLIDSEISDMFQKVINGLKENGVEIKIIEIPFMEEFNDAASVIFATEVYESLEQDLSDTPEKIEKEIRNRVLEGYFVKGSEYLAMQRVKKLAINTFYNVLQDVDVIMTPTLPAFPSKMGAKNIDINGKGIPIRNVYSRLVKASNLTGFPSIAVPKYKNKDGLFSSIQLIGLPFQEKNLYSFAYMIENL